MNMQELLDRYRQRFEEAAKQHERDLRKAKNEYEQMLAKAQADMDAIVDPENVSDTPQVKPTDAPAAAMIKAPDGEDMMVLNRQAIVMFLAIFDKLGEVSKELEKLTKKK